MILAKRGVRMKNLHSVAVILLIVGIFAPTGIAHAVDANFNSQLTNIRSADPSVPTDPTLGFDPCKGGTNASGICNSALAGTLLSTFNVGTAGTPGVFSLLGPGAITDNMFGIISGAALGISVGTADDTSTTRCAPGTGDANFDTQAGSPGLRGLNCGSIRINATQQGQVPPTGGNTLGLEGNGTVNTVTKNLSFIADNCASGAAGCTGSPHVGFNLTNDFTFRMNTDAAGAAIPAEATTTSTQIIRQVTGVNPGTGGAGIGTLLSPGGGDQFFEVTSSFTARSPDTPAGDPLDPLVVSWTQSIKDPDQSGTSGAKFEQSLAGSFTRDEKFLPLVTDPATGLPTKQSQVFTCGTVTAPQLAICTQYPTGASQSIGNISDTTKPQPLLP